MKKSINLPFEILDLVAYYTFSDNKSYQHLLVCRNWYHSFIPAFYRNVNVATRHQWINFYNTANKYRPLCLYVKNLHIDKSVGLSHQEIESLPGLFPFIETLYFNSDLWKYQRPKLDSSPSWNRLVSLPPLDCYIKTMPLLQIYGQYLRDISLCGNLVNSLHRIKLPKNSSMLINLFAMTPQSKSVTIHGRDKNNVTTFQSAQRAEFSLADIQNIHALLPSLESLELFDITLTTPSPTELLPEQFPKLKKFYIEGVVDHFVWLYYIAELYPNLLDLNLNVTFPTTLRMTRQDKELAKQGLQRIATTCKYLEKVNLGQTETSLDVNSQFFSHLSKKGLVSLSDSAKNERTFFGKAASENFASLMTCTKPDVTETLRIQLWRDLRNVQHIMDKIGSIKRLTSLQLTCGKFAYNWTYGCDIDTIAKYCPQMKTLDLSMACLTVSNTYDTVPISKIQTVRLHHTHFTTESMNMLAACCSELKNLELVGCVKDRDKLDQKVYIHFPNHHLETLVVDKLYLRPNKYIKKSTIDVALLATNYTDRNQRQLSRKSNQFNTRWYHLYCKKNKKTPGRSRRLRKLKPVEYFKVDTYEMKDKDWDLLEENTVRGTYRKKEFWSDDIPYGYLYINCKYIDNLKFNNVKL